jgi:hypothetical protein
MEQTNKRYNTKYQEIIRRNIRVSWIIGHTKIEARKFRETIFSFTFNALSDHKMQDKVIVRQME